MAYTKQNFEDGQVLEAEHLNHMEDGIENAVQYTEQSLTDEQKAQARANIGAIKSWDEMEGKPFCCEPVYWCQDALVDLTDQNGYMHGPLETPGCNPPPSGAYTVTLNGTVYEGLALKYSSTFGIYFIGNLSIWMMAITGMSAEELTSCGMLTEADVTGESFVLLCAPGYMDMYTTETTNPATLSVYGPSLKQIEAAYLPDSVTNDVSYKVNITGSYDSTTETYTWVLNTPHADILQAKRDGRPLIAHIDLGGNTYAYAALTAYIGSLDDRFVFHCPCAYMSTRKYESHTWMIHSDNTVTFE